MNVEVQAVAPEQVEADVLAVAADGRNRPLRSRRSTRPARSTACSGASSAGDDLRDEPGSVRARPRRREARHAPPGRRRTSAAPTSSTPTRYARCRDGRERRGDVGGTRGLAARRLRCRPTRPSRRAHSSTGHCSAATTRRAGRRDDAGRSKPLDARARRRRRTVSPRAPTRAALVAEWANSARDLVNSPPNETDTPSGSPSARREIACVGSSTSTAEALEPRARSRRRAWAPSPPSRRAATTTPRLVVLRYEPPSPTHPELVLGLVGKAITFDTRRASRSSRRCTWRT